MSPIVPASILAGDPRVARLFPNFKEVESAYFQQTRIFPIMHILAIKRALIEQHPWIPAILEHVFSAAKNLAYSRMAGIRAVPLAWFGSGWEEERRLLGPDPWRYGWDDANRGNLETLLRYMREQGLLHAPMKLDHVFVNG
jgi:4,5-dihydroxyphthalate decarboxylase